MTLMLNKIIMIIILAIILPSKDINESYQKHVAPNRTTPLSYFKSLRCLR